MHDALISANEETTENKKTSTFAKFYNQWYQPRLTKIKPIASIQ